MKYVYLIKNSEDDTYKIGIAKKPYNRLQQLQTGNPSELLLIETYKTHIPNKIEKALHRKYSYLKKQGEWFSFSITEELNFLKNCEDIEKNILFLQECGNVFT